MLVQSSYDRYLLERASKEHASPRVTEEASKATGMGRLSRFLRSSIGAPVNASKSRYSQKRSKSCSPPGQRPSTSSTKSTPRSGKGSKTENVRANDAETTATHKDDTMQRNMDNDKSSKSGRKRRSRISISWTLGKSTSHGSAQSIRRAYPDKKEDAVVSTISTERDPVGNKEKPAAQGARAGELQQTSMAIECGSTSKPNGQSHGSAGVQRTSSKLSLRDIPIIHRASKSILRRNPMGGSKASANSKSTSAAHRRSKSLDTLVDMGKKEEGRAHHTISSDPELEPKYSTNDSKYKNSALGVTESATNSKLTEKNKGSRTSSKVRGQFSFQSSRRGLRKVRSAETATSTPTSGKKNKTSIIKQRQN